MKPVSTFRFLFYLWFLFVVSSACAQTPVTGVFTHFVNATTSTSYTGGIATGTSTSTMTNTTYTYWFGTNVSATNNKEILDSFTATGLNYYFMPATPTIKFRRVNNTSTTGLRKSLWIQENTSVQTATLMASVPPYDDSLERIFSGQQFNVGMDNNFQNATTTNNNNIERVDVIFPGGITATSDLTKLGFVVFDRGAGGGHDPFVVAAIKTLDANGDPSAYFTAVPVAATNYGNVAATSAPFNIFRKNDDDSKLLIQTLNTAQQRDGVLLTFSALNVSTTGTKIYGYSLFSTDAPTSTSAGMVAYASFPTTTDLSGGGLDQVAVTGVAVTKASFIVLAEYLDGFSVSPADNGKVRLDWTLNMVGKINKTVIERSGNGTDFLELAADTDPSKGAQHAVDDHPLDGVNYYRLKLVDSDGGLFMYSPVCSIVINQAAAASLTLYPVPVKNRQFTLNAQGLGQEPYDCRIFNMSGSPVLTIRLPSGQLFPMNIVLPTGLSPGIYTLQLSGKQGKMIVQKTFLID